MEVLRIHKRRSGLAYCCISKKCGYCEWKDKLKIKKTSMKKHIMSKQCWCKPEVISFGKGNDNSLSDKIFKIAALFNDSMDNIKYNKILKILNSK